MGKGALLIISGPSGSGKSTICKNLLNKMENVVFSVSTTTRAPREGEQEGVDYHFVTKEEFINGIEDGEFLEWAEVHGNFYGTSKSVVEKLLAQGKLILFDIDVQGFKILKAKLPAFITSVFVTTPTLDVLKTRLVNRGTDTKETIEKRLANAKEEMHSLYDYDYLIINDNLEFAKEGLYNIAKAAFYKTTLTDKETLKNRWGVS